MKPILFNTEMVQANLDGRKKATRRLVKGYVLGHLEIDTDCTIIGVYDQNEGCVRPVMDFAPYQPGDVLYVRETWCKDVGRYMYRANYSDGEKFYRGGKEVVVKWRPSIHMPKEAARLFLRVTGVRVERLQDIDDEGAKAEGANWRNGKQVGFEEKTRRSAVDRFAEIWNTTIKPADREKYGWGANPWVWVIEFERCEKPKEV